MAALFFEMNLADKIGMVFGWIIFIVMIGACIYIFGIKGKKMDEAQSQMTAPETVHVTLEGTEHGQVMGKSHYYAHFRTDDGRKLRFELPSKQSLREMERKRIVYENGVAKRRMPSGMLTYFKLELIAFERDGE